MGREIQERIVMEHSEMEGALREMARQIVRDLDDPERLVLVGIHTGGVYLAQRLGQILEREHGLKVPIGTLDINLYRDDWSRLHTQPVVRSTRLPFSVDDKDVVLVDDVLFTGRTIRAALDALMDYGRPRRVRVAALVDRGHRELPICAHFVGLELETLPEEQVNVYLKEKDGSDRVVLECRTAA
ncbi:MAG: bifunctional pyr operon transcriptional regulator/uracil phosphoribosyltransferase PyrR [Desulfacinum sp.]|jgi:pyrimidine operon attenuation protein/uracil phosphoribosyltransferase|nr:bifunctional pyr operon transcriptional regulator/uracil phosphoribosyltransferase PyrR [Desulfacinum sp.]